MSQDIEKEPERRNRTESIHEQHQRMFKRNLKIWMIRWSVGFTATAWFTISFPEHMWLWWIAIGTALFSLSVMYIGNRYISRKFMNFDQKKQSIEEGEKKEEFSSEKKEG